MSHLLTTKRRFLRIACFSVTLWLGLTGFPGLLLAKPSGAENKAFAFAQKTFQDTQYDVALVKLQEFAKTFPKSERAVEVSLLMGQSAYFLGQYDLTISTLQALPNTATADQKAEATFWLAETYTKQKNWIAATEAYSNFNKNFPESKRANESIIRLSEALLSSNKPVEALTALEPLMALKTTDKERHPAVLQQARILTAQSKFSDAENLLSLLLKEKVVREVLFPASYLTGEINLQLKKWAEAKIFFSRVTGDSRAFPKSLVAESWIGIGLAEQGEQKWVQAAEAFEKALDFSQELALFERAVVLYLGAHSKADTLAKATLKIRQLARDRKERGGMAFYAIGKFYYESGNYDAAISELDNFISNNPQSPWALNSRLLIADSLYKKKDIDASVATLRLLIKEKKTAEVLVQAQLRLAEILYDQADYLGAAENFLALSALDSFSAGLAEDAYFRGLIALAKTNNSEEFSKQFKQFMTKYPLSFKKNELLLEQATLIERAGGGEEARKIYEAVAKETSESKAEALLRLGLSFYNEGAYELAIPILVDFEKTFPENAYLSQAVYTRIMAQVESNVLKSAEVRGEYESFLTRFPKATETALIHFKIADTYSFEGNHEEAQKRFEKLATDFPTAKNALADFALYRAGISAMAQGEYKNAVVILEKIPEPSPTKTASRLAQVRCYMAQNNYLDAIRICDSVLMSHQDGEDWAEASLRKANCLYTLASEDPQKYKLALEISNKILNSKEVSVHRRNEAGHLKGAALQKLSRPTEAMEAYLDVVYGQVLPSDITGVEQHPEFYWLIKSGLAAATMREDKGDVRGAVEIYRILERLGDPNREEFRRKIESLKSKNFLYEDS